MTVFFRYTYFIIAIFQNFLNPCSLMMLCKHLHFMKLILIEKAGNFKLNNHAYKEVLSNYQLIVEEK